MFLTVKMIYYSPKGHDFMSNPLTDDSTLTELIRYEQAIYEHGNRYHGRIELFCEGRFLRVVSMSDIHLVKDREVCR